MTIGHTCPHYRITLNSEARQDLKLWLAFSINYNGKSCCLFKDAVSSGVIKLFSDAADVDGGFAAVFGSKWFAGEWPVTMKELHITVKSLFSIVLALDIWGPLLAKHRILFLTVAEIINKTSSKDKIIMKLVRRLVLAALKHTIHFKAKNIPGKTNVICDLLSRFSFQEAHRIAPWLNANSVVVPSHHLITGCYKFMYNFAMKTFQVLIYFHLPKPWLNILFHIYSFKIISLQLLLRMFQQLVIFTK